MNLIECPTCGLQYDKDTMDKCPFCEVDKNHKPNYNKRTRPNNESNSTNDFRPNFSYHKEPTLSRWHTFATIILILSIVGVLVLAFISILEKNAIYIIAGISEFLIISLFCGIVHLLADIKLCIEKLHYKQ